MRALIIRHWLVILLVGDAVVRGQAQVAPAPPRVWPPAPAPAQIRYAESICGPADIGQKPSVFTRVAGLVSGRSSSLPALVKPFGLALDEADNLCVTDTGSRSISYCDFAHKRWRTWAAAGNTRFVSPVAIARKAKVFYVADSELGKVLAFREDGALVFELGAPLQRPVGLALGDDTLYVADSQAHSISAFDLRGRLRFSFGRRGTGPGEFNFPTHLWCDAQKQVCVTDSMNARVQVFAPDGKFSRTVGSAGDTSGHFSRPKGIAADRAGHLYVLDALFDNFQIFDGQGRFLLGVGEAGEGPGEFWLPNGIAIDSKNRIYVADSFNRRVQVFDYLGKE
jgi:DNA-binding beta-propeller fold protein YncE